MRTIAIINQKGGVGKTTTAVNLSAALAEQSQRVCLIDLDPQAHASLHLGVALREDRGSVYQVLTGDTRLSQVRLQIDDHLWLVPSHLDLAAAELELAGEVGRELVLRDKLVLDDGDFDYLIIDCPPSLGVLTLNALTAVKEIFLPLQPHFLALHGFGKLLHTVDVVAQRLNPGLRLAGVVLCMYESGTRLAAEVTSDVEEFLAQQQVGHCRLGRRQEAFGRGFAATSDWPKRPVSVKPSFNTRPIPTARKTTGGWPAKCWAFPWMTRQCRRDVAGLRLRSRPSRPVCCKRYSHRKAEPHVPTPGRSGSEHRYREFVPSC